MAVGIARCADCETSFADQYFANVLFENVLCVVISEKNIELLWLGLASGSKAIKENGRSGRSCLCQYYGGSRFTESCRDQEIICAAWLEIELDFQQEQLNS